jgi:hypothetical protein
MTAHFEQEFYKSAMQRVLPVGPDGIQPYVWPAGRRQASLGAGLRRLAGILGPAVDRIVAFGRRTAVGTSKRPLALTPPAHRLWLRLAPVAEARRPRRGAQPRSLSKAA